MCEEDRVQQPGAENMLSRGARLGSRNAEGSVQEGQHSSKRCWSGWTSTHTVSCDQASRRTQKFTEHGSQTNTEKAV